MENADIMTAVEDSVEQADGGEEQVFERPGHHQDEQDDQDDAQCFSG